MEIEVYKFSEETRKLLYRSGWSEDRRVDIEEYKEYYTDTKQPVSELTFQFLSSFGGLSVTIPSRKFPKQTVTLFSINPHKYRIWEDAKDYGEQWIKKPLYDVGIIQNTSTFAVTHQGECYLMFDDFVILFGTTITEGIETLCAGKPGVIIPPPTSDFVWR